MMKTILIILLMLPLVLVGKPHKQYKYMQHGILDFSESTGNVSGNDTSGNSSSSGAVFFSHKTQQPLLTYHIKPLYNIIKRISVTNKSATSVSIKVIFSKFEDFIMGIAGSGGDDYITIPSNKQVSLPVRFFPQDSRQEKYPFTAQVVDAKGVILDTVKGVVFLEKATPDISITLHKRVGAVHVYKVMNNAPALSNVSIVLQSQEKLLLTPQVDHYYFPAGKSLLLKVYPRQGVTDDIKSSFVVSSHFYKKQFPITYSLAGQRLEVVTIDPVVRLRKKDYYCTNRPIIHVTYGVPYIKMQLVDDLGFSAKFSWLKEKGAKFDMDRDGKPDQWILVENGVTIMKGDDYDGDGSIDYFREVDSKNRSLNRAYVKKNNRWYETNIVDAYLISSYLPTNEGVAVKPHDLDVLLNDKTVYSRNKIIPMGSRIVKLRIDQLRENSLEGISYNKITVATRHLPEAHYMINAENTLVMHYSQINIPVVTKKRLAARLDSVNKKIRDQEKVISEEKNAVKKKVLQQVLDEYKTYRDKKLAEINTFMDKKYAKAMELSGVQYRGADLALYSSEMVIKGKTLHGFVRNMGYMTVPYKLYLYKKQGNKMVLLQQRTFHPLPAFCYRDFLFQIKSHQDAERTVYKIEVKPLGLKDKELVTSNNSAHVVTGPAAGPHERKEELVFLAHEMGLANDKLTLVRAPQLPIFNFADFKDMNIKQVFPAPDTNFDQSGREFVLE